MAKPKKRLNPEEVQAAALAAYLLSVSTLRFFLKKGTLSLDEVGLLLTGVLSQLEKSDLVSEPAAHGARSLLTALGSELGIQLKQPN
jgi:hypothetical protein